MRIKIFVSTEFYVAFKIYLIFNQCLKKWMNAPAYWDLSSPAKLQIITEKRKICTDVVHTD
jgi:hypothetical protein